MFSQSPAICTGGGAHLPRIIRWCDVALAKLMLIQVTRPEGENARTAQATALPGAPEKHAGVTRRLLKTLGLGLVTGASDDDPSGIGTYSQVGAQFGYGNG